MTPEERAAELVALLNPHWRGGPNPPGPSEFDHVRKLVAAAIREAEAAVRERCAEIARGAVSVRHFDIDCSCFDCISAVTADDIAARIQEDGDG